MATNRTNVENGIHVALEERTFPRLLADLENDTLTNWQVAAKYSLEAWLINIWRKALAREKLYPSV